MTLGAEVNIDCLSIFKCNWVWSTQYFYFIIYG